MHIASAEPAGASLLDRDGNQSDAYCICRVRVEKNPPIITHITFNYTHPLPHL